MAYAGKQELEFQTSPAICIESLIAINKKVGQPQAALGILKYAQNNLPVSVREDWLSKLGHWEVSVALHCCTARCCLVVEKVGL